MSLSKPFSPRNPLYPRASGEAGAIGAKRRGTIERIEIRARRAREAFKGMKRQIPPAENLTPPPVNTSNQ